MPCDYVVDVERRLVSSRAWGEVTDADLLDHQRRLAQDLQFHRDFSQLWDFLAVTSFKGVTANAIREGARRHLFGPRARRAIVVSDPTIFGLARMFGTYRDIAHGEEQIRIFKNLEEAWAWLTPPPDHA